MAKPNLLSWILFALLALIWGSSFILMKKSAAALDGWQIGSVRIMAAGLVFLPFAFFHIRKLPPAKLPLIFMSGVLGNLLPAFLFAIAIVNKVNSSIAGILNAMTPLFVILLGLLFFGTKVAPRKWLGVLIGLLGMVLLNVAKGPLSLDHLWPIGLILLATLFYGINVNMVGKYLKGVEPLRMATVSLAFVSIPATLIAFLTGVFAVNLGDGAVRTALVSASFLGITGSAVATALLYLLIQKAGALFASLVTYAIPVVAIVWGLIDGESITPLQLGCMALILGGVYLVNRK